MARLHVTGHGAELASIGLRLARESGSARRLFNWMERTRAGALRTLPTGSGQDPALVSYLVQFREADAELRRATLNGDPHFDLAKRANELREKVRDVALWIAVVLLFLFALAVTRWVLMPEVPDVHLGG